MDNSQPTTDRRRITTSTFYWEATARGESTCRGREEGRTEITPKPQAYMG